MVQHAQKRVVGVVLGGPSVLSCVDLGGDVGARDGGEEEEEEEKASVEMLQRFREHGYGCRED